MTGCIRCNADSTVGYLGLYCRECIEDVAWTFKRARENDPDQMIQSLHTDTDRIRR